MKAENEFELIRPREVEEGDVIVDPAGGRRLTVTEIQVVSGAGSGVFSFYGEGPHDAVTVAGDEQVKRSRARPPPV
ncbi:hypothetical protein ACWDTP_22490 [Mycobacterium sp. NPDC003449]